MARFLRPRVALKLESDTASSLPLCVSMLASPSPPLLHFCLSSFLLSISFCQFSYMATGQNKQCQKAMIRKAGPWGGKGGSSWDDGIYFGVREITLVYHKCIDSIQVVYDKIGKPFKAEKHGGDHDPVFDSKTVEIKLQYPREFLTSVSGHYSPVEETGPVIRSLAFKSNLRDFGPFGVEQGSKFAFSVDNGEIVGFMGRSGWFLDRIGIYYVSCPIKNSEDSK